MGRLDSRFKGIDENAAGETPEFDPRIAAIRPPYTATFNQYVRSELGYKTDLPYYILGGGISAPWDWGSAGGGFPDVSASLRNAFVEEPGHEALRRLGLLRPGARRTSPRSTRSRTWGSSRPTARASRRASTRPAT